MSKLDEAIELYGQGDWPPLVTALVEFAKEHKECRPEQTERERINESLRKIARAAGKDRG